MVRRGRFRRRLRTDLDRLVQRRPVPRAARPRGRSKPFVHLPADREPFALTYAVLLAVLVWQWASVYRTDSPEYRPGALRYLAGLVVAIGALLASAAMEDDARLAVWAAVVVGSIALVVVYMLRSPDDSLQIGPHPRWPSATGCSSSSSSARWS